MKKTLLAAAVLAITFNASAASTVVENVDFKIGVSSDFRENGISKSDKDPVVKGSANYKHENGFYIGTEATSTGDNDVVDAEVDVFLGKQHTFSNDITLDVQLRTSTFHGSSLADEFNYHEVSTTLSHNGFSAGVTYTNDHYGSDLNNLITNLSYTEALSKGFITVDFQHIKAEEAIHFGEDSYVSYGVTYLHPVTEDLEFSIGYIGTNVDKDSDMFEIAQDTVVADITWKF
jgi:uncharacterized protein (TIGR02001 family)